MDTMIRQLREIEQSSLRLGEAIRHEGQICRAELEERQRLGLHGEDAIKHYNEWMERYGLTNLMLCEK